jgi:peroxiredoxin
MIDTRRYKWMIGIFGLVLVVAISVYQFASHGVGETGVSPGHRLHFFAAPLAATTLQGDPNANPTCSAARHDPRALNVCLMARRGPMVLSFFVPGASQCVRQVSALQALASRFPTVQFAAVAIDSSHQATAALVRGHRWTIPVAYDRDGRVGALYGVAACPMAELADRGGMVRDRLIGNRWQTAAALAPEVQRLLTPATPAG